MDDADREAPHLRLLAPALTGYAGTRRMDGQTRAEAEDGNALLHFIERTTRGGRVDLVGHSYGGATALSVTVARPELVRTLTLVEPVVFSVLDAENPAGAGHLTTLASDQIDRITRGEFEAAAKALLEYWGGPRAWSALDGARRTRIAALMPKIATEWRYLLSGRPEPESIARVRVPVRIFCGELTTPAAHAIAASLRVLLPKSEYSCIPFAGHMLPLTHARVVNPMILGGLSGDTAVPGSPTRGHRQLVDHGERV